MQNPRNKLVSIRMTSGEYDLLCSASEGQGSRTVSEFARTALLNSQKGASRATCPSLSALDERITRVEREVDHVKEELIAKILAQNPTATRK